MGDDPKKKHEGLIEPRSKEDMELTKALYRILDEADRRNKERKRRKMETAKIEQERRIREGLPLEDTCYFARFTKGMYVREEDLHNLWEEDRVAVHLTESELDSGSSQRGKLAPKDYPAYEKAMVKTLLQISEMGGYVWLENRSGKSAKIGVVRPGTRIESIEARWAETNNPKHKGKAGTATTLRTLPLEKVRVVSLTEVTPLWASRPLVSDYNKRNLQQWEPACGKFRLVSLVDDKNRSQEATWNELPPDLKLTVCTDFLRYHVNPNYPNLKFLLLAPSTVRRDVDICGMAKDGTEIMAQVPFQKNRAKEGFEARRKSELLQTYRESGRRLICFIPGLRGDLEDVGQDLKLFKDSSPLVRDGVLLIPVQEVLDWLEGQSAYHDKLFSP